MRRLFYNRFKIGLFFILLGSLSCVFANKPHLIIKERYITVPGGQVWVQTNYYQNTKHKTPILIVHGGPGVPHDYLNNLVALAKQRPVIFYDQLGCGHSQIKKNDNALWTLNRFEQELNVLVKKIHLPKFYLFGHSWGGGLAAHYTLKHPEKVKGLILSSPLLSTSKWMSDSKILLEQLDTETKRIIETSEATGETDSVEYQKAMNNYYQRYVCRLEPWPKELIYAFDHMNLDVYHTMWGPSEFTMNGNLRNFDVTNELALLNVPALVTVGRYDEARPETIGNVVKNIKDTTMIIYSNSAHLAFLEEHKRYLNDLMSFLKKLDDD